MIALLPGEVLCPLCRRPTRAGTDGRLPGHYSQGPGIGYWCSGPGENDYEYVCRACGEPAPLGPDGMTATHYQSMAFCTGSGKIPDLAERTPERVA